MSEYQYIHFMAIDRPLDEKQLGYMHKQSSRAEITPYAFTNEYHFGDFHGNATEMLRRGYDIHLHYANFGIRKLMIRLPMRPPCDRRTFDAFLIKGEVEWIADKNGKGGILNIDPEADAGSYDEVFYEADDILPEIAPLRNALIGGDVRALYIAWLACAYDEGSLEPPVPAGLGKLTPDLNAMAVFYEIDDDLLTAASEQSPPLPNSSDSGDTLKDWIDKQPEKSLRSLVKGLLSEQAAEIRAETLARIRDESGAAAWPTAEPTRTLGQLRELSKKVGDLRLQREKKAKEAARRKQLSAIAADPNKTIANVEKLVKTRSTINYEKAAEELADLRESLGPEKGPVQARTVAEKLRRENPTLKLFVSALRKHGLLG